MDEAVLYIKRISKAVVTEMDKENIEMGQLIYVMVMSAHHICQTFDRENSIHVNDFVSSIPYAISAVHEEMMKNTEKYTKH